MKNKKLKLVITFYTTADAIATEQVCKENNIAGRIIPVPRALSSGCGLSWSGNPSERDVLVKLLNESKIEVEGVYECLL